MDEEFLLEQKELARQRREELQRKQKMEALKAEKAAELKKRHAEAEARNKAAASEGDKPGLEPTTQSQSQNEAFSAQQTSSVLSVPLSVLYGKPTNTLDLEPEWKIRQRYEREQRELEIKRKEDAEIELERRKREALEFEQMKEKLPGKNSPVRKGRGVKKPTWGGKGKKKLAGMTDSEAFEKGQNFQRQTMSKSGKYKERVSSKAGYNKAHFYPNGKRKSFYKNRPENQEEKLETNGDKFEVAIEEHLGTDKMTVEQKKEHIMKVRAVQGSDLADADSSTVTRENVFFKLMNEGFKMLMIEYSNITQYTKDRIAQRIANLGKCALIENIQDEDAMMESWKKVLHDYFKHEDFYPFQKTLLKKLHRGENCMADFFTGAGKSLLFQFHSVIHNGITIVLVPLLTLMVDQVKKIPDNVPAICYNSWMTYSDRNKVLHKLRQNKIKVLFVTPELFANDIVWYLLVYKVRVNMLAIDEAHCASVYSQNFRPAYALLEEYLKMIQTREFPDPLAYIFNNNNQDMLPPISQEDGEDLAALERQIEGNKPGISEETTDPVEEIAITDKKTYLKGQERLPLLCLTATSSQETKNSVLSQFRIQPSNYLHSNFYMRENLKISVSIETHRIKDIDKFLKLERIRGKKPILVYCNFNYTISGVKRHLQQCGYYAEEFHGSLCEIQRMNTLQKFLLTDPSQKKKEDDVLDLGFNKIDAIVTSVALAMGIDHRSIKTVIHNNMPNSLETYIQEIGRGGRNGENCYCHTFLNQEDYFFQRAKFFSDYFLDRCSLRLIVRYLLGQAWNAENNKNYMNKKKNRKRNQEAVEAENIEDMKYTFIKNDSVKSKLRITKEEFYRILHVFRDMLREDYGIDFSYVLDINSKGTIKPLKYTKTEQFNAHPLIKLIKKNSRKIRNDFIFNTIQIANKFGVNPHYLRVSLLELAQDLQFNLNFTDYSVAFTNLQHRALAALTKKVNLSAMVDHLYRRNLRLIRESTTKLDSFYVLLRSQAKKPMHQFIDADLADSASPRLEKYVKLYFETGSRELIQELRKDGLMRHLPILFVEGKFKGVDRGAATEREVVGSTEIKDAVATLFKVEKSVVNCSMTESKGYSNIFRDFLRLIYAQKSESFPPEIYGDWGKNADRPTHELWGLFRHYDILEVLGEIEEIFEEGFKATKTRGYTVAPDIPGEDLDDPILGQVAQGIESESEDEEKKPSAAFDSNLSKPLVQVKMG